MRALLALLLSCAVAHADAPRAMLGVAGGISLQNDQYIAGVQGGARGLGLSFLDLEGRLTVGLGPDYLMVRPALHVAPRLQIDDFRAYLLAGGSLVFYRPRGAYGDFCDKAEIDDCGGVAAGLDLGLGLGWRWLGGDVVFGTGDLPLWTFTFTFTVLL